MKTEDFKPISVKPPSQNYFLFYLRCLIDIRLFEIVKKLRPELQQLSGNILDVGAGESPWKEYLNSKVKYFGIDIKEAVQFGMTQKTQAHLTVYDGKIIPFDDCFFDGAFCIEVLEHAEFPDLLLAEIHRVLKKDTCLILTMPWSARRHHIPFDFQRFTPEKLNKILASHHFQNIEINEMGNDISVVANKLILINLRLFWPSKLIYIIWTWPLAFLMLFVSFAFLMCSFICIQFNLGSKDDPLGYFVVAKK